MIALEVIEDTARLRDFQPEWSRFVQADPTATPFQTPEWLITWWTHFGSGALRILTFREKGRVIGIFPCFRHLWNNRQQLTPLGAGITDYLDPLFESRNVAGILDLMRSYLSACSDWDICYWQDLRAETPFRILGNVLEATPGSLISLAQTYQAFSSSLPKDLKRNLRRYKEKAEKISFVGFDVAETAQPELMNALIALHSARWSHKGEEGMISTNHSEAFLREVANTLGSRGMLKIFSLTFCGRITAIILALCNRTTIFSYLSAFDPEYETYGFGRELISQALRYAHEYSYKRWDFLRGAEPYKFSWGARPVPKCHVEILRSSRGAS